MSTAPRFDIDLAAFAADPYPALRRMRQEAPIAFVPQLGATVFARRDAIYTCEKNIAVFSSVQPGGLMNVLMGENMMRKDGEAHMAERRAIFPTVSPKTVKAHWLAKFQAHAARILAALAPQGRADLRNAFAMPFSGACLMDLTGLTQVKPQDLDAWSQGMIDGIANYAGDPAIEARCHAATAAIDAAISERWTDHLADDDFSLLAVMRRAGLPEDAIRANIKLAISGGQNEPRDAIAGAVFALLTHPEQRRMIETGAATWNQAFDEYCRWNAPIGMTPRRVTQAFSWDGVDFDEGDRVFFLFSSANRDETCFDNPDVFDVTRDTAKAIPFGAGPHFCAGAWASRAMIAEVALPALFATLPGLRLDAAAPPVRFSGWAFRGPESLPAVWN